MSATGSNDRPLRASEEGGPSVGAPAISGHQNALDGLRAIAAFAVLVVHVGGATGVAFRDTAWAWLVARGEIGVPIFFVLSGLLLYRPWAQAVLADAARPDVRAYLWRRVLRVMPAYWVVVAVALFAFSPDRVRDLGTWLTWLLMLQNYDPSPWWPGTGPEGLIQMWTLPVELAFYVTLPIMAGLLGWYATRGRPPLPVRARRLLVGLGLFAAASIVFTILMFHPEYRPRWALWLPRHWIWFAPGMAIAVITVWARVEPGPDGPIRRFCRGVGGMAGSCWLLALLCYGIVSTPLAGPASIGVMTEWESVIRLVLYAVIAVLVVAPTAFQPERETVYGWLLGNPVMSYLGRISYSVFLWHAVVISGFYELTDRRDFTGNFWLILAVTLAGTLLVSAASYRFVEEPVRRLNKLVPPRRGATPQRAAI